MSKFCFYGIVVQLIVMSLLKASIGEAQKHRKINEIYLNVGFKEMNLLSVFEQIEENTEFKFFYYDELPSTKITLKKKNRNLEQTLSFIGEQANLSFKRVNNNISVSNWSRSVESKKRLQEDFVYREITVSGVVKDENGNSLPGVNVIVKNTATGGVTNLDGLYKINVDGDNAVLVFSFIGYETQEVPVNGRTTIDVALLPDYQQLEEVVVIGYDAIKKSDLTGSVTSVKSTELTAYPTVNAISALQGRAAGVQVESNNGGEPGAGFKVRIRGGTSINASSDPLYVVDGFIGGILPAADDISSIEILKDASATAIYGSRGANGVVMITTKKGSVGQTKIEFNSSYSYQKEMGRMEMLKRDDFLEYMAEATDGLYIPGPAGVDTDWADEILVGGSTQNYQLSVSGGTDNVNYYVSGTYFDQKGVVRNSNFDRFSVVSNINLKASEKFNLGLNLLARRTMNHGVPTQGGQGGAFPGAYLMGPDIPVYNTDGSFARAKLPIDYDNPFAATTQRINDNGNDQLQGNFFVEYEIIKGLTFKSTFGMNNSNSRSGNYTQRTLLDGQINNGIANLSANRSSNVLNEDYFTYKKSLGENSISVTAGYSYNMRRQENLSASTRNFVSDLYTYNFLSAGTVPGTPSSSFTESKTISYFGRATFNIGDLFSVTATARRDGSSVFSEGKKWAFFPSAAVAWNIGNMPFLEGSSTINELKMRVSYGKTGNQAVGAYQTFARLSSYVTIVDGQQVNALRPSDIANPDLSWETTAQANIGVDIGLIDGRFNASIDYYSMKTTDLLFEANLPTYTGFLTQTQNIGSLTNKGIDVALSGNIISGGDLEWTSILNISANRNKITELPEHKDIFYGFGPGHLELRNPNVLREGEPLGVYHGRIFEGVYQSGESFLIGGNDREGEAKFADLDNDGDLDNDDKTIIGNPNPDFIWGWTNNLTYKGFDFNLFIQSSVGNDKYNYTKMEAETFYAQANASIAALDRWTTTNTSSNIPRAQAGGNRTFSSRFVSDGSYIRFKNVALGYTFPISVVETLSLTKLRVYVSAQNLFTISSYEGIDPENNWGGGGSGFGSNATLGYDYGSYPSLKSYTIGLNVGF